MNAQNLVINPGFEEHNKKGQFNLSNGFQSLGVKSWYLPTSGTSDFLWVAPDRVDEEYFLSHYTGKTQANSGECFAGFHAGMSYFEYVGGTLSRKLEKGQTYKVAIALQLGSRLKGHSDAIDVYFSREKTETSGTRRLRFVPQVSFTGTGDKSVSGNWKIFTAEFTAEGDEQFFIIGNITGKNTSANSGGYYFIDDVYVAPAGSDTSGFPVAAVKPLEPGQPIAVKVASPSMDNKAISNDTIAAGKTLVCSNVCFESDQSVITAESYLQLYLILAELKKQPGLKVEIDGHTDADGGNEHNQVLSEERARAVADFFISNGIDASRISTRGFGSSRPVSDDKKMNRRVEFIFSD